jgi:uncharacterized protein (DUF1810 family)
MSNKDHNLERFVIAQERIFPSVLTELRCGEKSGHWMWFIFPQIRGLGRSKTAQFYSIESQDEARQYTEHPLLGARLVECTQIVLRLEGRSVHAIFGYPDDLKFRSSMTLFSKTAPNPEIYQQSLMKYFGGAPDQRTLDILMDLE